MNDSPRVFLVGAGPGNPGLLTLRAVQCLQRADYILYDTLVSPAALDHAAPRAKRVCVTELGPRHAERIGPIQQALIEAARHYQCVVRLKGGDPFLFGRGGEEAEALAAAGIPYEVVPGVSAALGIGAYTGIPLTHRGVASAVAFVAGHEDPDKGEGEGETAVDWAAVAKFTGTLAIYMGLGRLANIAQTLMQHGKSADTTAAVIHAGTTSEQQIVTASLGDIASAVRTAGLTSPSLILIGPVVALREHLAWSEKRPLYGRRILVCRPRAQVPELVQQLEELGAVPLVLPTVEITPPADWSPVDAALDRLSDFHWLVFTSVNGVSGFLGRLLERGRDLRALGTLQLAAIGPSTAAALRSWNLEPDLVPEEYRSESLAAALKLHVAGCRVLLARADRGRDVLREELQTIAEVHQVAVYSQSDTVGADVAILERLRKGDVNYVLLTSANIARSLARLLDEATQTQIKSSHMRIVSISPVTSAAIRELGWPVAAEAAEFTMAGVVKALLTLNRMHPSLDG